jgi:deoxycytidylate deaminase
MDTAKIIRDCFNEVLKQSDDQNTQTGAVLTTPEGKVLLSAANTLTIGMKPTEENTTRPGKVPYMEHAERNVIYKAGREGVATKGLHMHMRWFPCIDCARAIVGSGIAVLHCDPQPEQHELYRFEEAGGLLEYAGVVLVPHQLDEDELNVEPSP